MTQRGGLPVKASTHYFETTSDAFFTNEAAFLEQHGIDVALIDGSTPMSRSCATSRTSGNPARWVPEGADRRQLSAAAGSPGRDHRWLMVVGHVMTAIPIISATL